MVEQAPWPVGAAPGRIQSPVVRFERLLVLHVDVAGRVARVVTGYWPGASATARPPATSSPGRLKSMGRDGQRRGRHRCGSPPQSPKDERKGPWRLVQPNSRGEQLGVSRFDDVDWRNTPSTPSSPLNVRVHPELVNVPPPLTSRKNRSSCSTSSSEQFGGFW